jgi:hypothetical protein
MPTPGRQTRRAEIFAAEADAGADESVEQRGPLNQIRTLELYSHEL